MYATSSVGDPGSGEFGRPRICGIGACTVDVLFVLSPVQVSLHSQLATEFSLQVGGPVATSLMAAARLGAKTQVVAQVGDDWAGRIIRDSLQEVGVNVENMVLVPGGSSRIVLVLVDPNTAERSFVFRPDSMELATKEQIQAAGLEETVILLVDEASPCSIAAARVARRARGTVIFSGSWAKGKLRTLLRLVDICVVSDEFFSDWSFQEGAPRSVLDLKSASTAAVVIETHGKDGCTLWEAGESKRFPAFPVAAVDSTGAGDAFTGGLVFGISEGWPMSRAIEVASACGALSCTRLGGSQGLPDRRQIESFLAESKRR
ncbi:MAG TPA: carbohydrate kinase family protein [Thermoanaerobaculia bacterium]|nr:carbohydrate kinase family protein [Thermoanaerobaculia bacterium]